MSKISYLGRKSDFPYRQKGIFCRKGCFGGDSRPRPRAFWGIFWDFCCFLCVKRQKCKSKGCLSSLGTVFLSLSTLRYWLVYVFWYPSYWWGTFLIGVALGLASMRDRPLEARRDSCLRAAHVLDSASFRTAMAAFLRLHRTHLGREAAKETLKTLNALRNSIWAIARTL